MRKYLFWGIVIVVIGGALFLGLGALFNGSGDNATKLSGSGDYVLHVSEPEYGVVTEKVVPEAEQLSVAQQLITLPGGAHPDVRWTTHVVGTPRVFEIDPITKLPTAEIIVTEGSSFPCDRQFSISVVEAGSKIFWTREYLAATPTTAPTEAPATEAPTTP